MRREIFDGTGRVSNNGTLRLSRDLVPVTDRVQGKVKKSTKELHIVPPHGSGPSSKVRFPRPGVPVVSIVEALKALDLTPYQARGLYEAVRIGSKIIIKLGQKLRVDNEQLRPWDSTRWSCPFQDKNTAIRQGFDMARRGVTKPRIKRLCRKMGVGFQPIWNTLLSPGRHGCEVWHKGDWIKLLTPSEAKKFRRWKRIDGAQ